MFGVVVVVVRGWLLVIEECGGKVKVLRNNDKLWAGETSLPADRAALRSNSGIWCGHTFLSKVYSVNERKTYGFCQY
jgi:hypothetical protein